MQLNKILETEALQQRLAFWRTLGETIVFTNGCFDVLHLGHVHLLHACRQLGDRVIVGLNSDASVKRLKGPSRPVHGQQSRALVLAALEAVDAIVVFEEDTPLRLIEAIHPDVLVKGGDWAPEKIVGADVVQQYGGRVVSVPYLDGYSTTGILQQHKS